MQRHIGTMSFSRGLRGFTLVELVVVIIIIGIVGGAMGTMFIDRDDYDQRFFYDDVLTALRYAQKLAIATGCDTGVDFTASGFAVYRRASCTSGALTSTVTHPGKDPSRSVQSDTYQNTNLPSGLSLSSTVDPVVFDTLGRAKTSGGTVSNVTVTVGSRTVTVIGETGFVYNPNG